MPTKISFITRKSWIKYWKRQTRVSIIMTSTIGECVLLYTVAYSVRFFLKTVTTLQERLWQISPNKLWWMEGYYLKRRSANVSGYRGSPLNSRRGKSHWWRHPLPAGISAIRKRRSFWIYCWWSFFYEVFYTQCLKILPFLWNVGICLNHCVNHNPAHSMWIGKKTF